MQPYEKLGVLYLGRHRDPASPGTAGVPYLYDSRDLLTHALCAGMTGSGKTGLCLGLIEEAAIDGIPALIIDPKGDLTNLLLTFPDLQPADFAPWVNPDDARRRGVSLEDHAAREAARWRDGLAAWDQDGDRIRRLREAADFVIYTPGSTAGLPLSILDSFAPPPAAVLDDPELLRDRVQTTVTGLLGLLGLDADPLRSREAVFLANLFQSAWQEERALDLAALIREIQDPPFRRVGVMELETFLPARDRFALATTLNGLVAAPGFSTWLEGEPLDVGRLLHTPDGRPRVAICSIAHLDDAGRMFFVTLLLNQVLGWMRAQSGTTSLRALLYMDEIAGFFPPVANPPSKTPLLLLLKQARAFGLGVVLATQNPVDLDYKGLGNIGTWFLGRLQTERDLARVLDGLEAVAGPADLDRAGLARMLAGLDSRVFLVRNVHEPGVTLCESRWCLSYLRGPLSRPQIKALMDPRRSGAARAGQDLEAATATPDRPGPASVTAAATHRPSLPPGIDQFFLPAAATGREILYEPMLLGAASVRFADARLRVEATRDVVLLTRVTEDPVPVEWSQAETVVLDLDSLLRDPAPGAQFTPLPAAAVQARNYASWRRDFLTALQSSRRLELLRSPATGLVSGPEEPEGVFRTRVQQVLRERRDDRVAELKEKFAPRFAALAERLRKAGQAVEREARQAREAHVSTAVSIGTTLLGALLGRRSRGVPSLGRTSTTLRRLGRSGTQAADVDRAREDVEAVRRQMAELDDRFRAAIRELEQDVDSSAGTLEPVQVRPVKSGIAVQIVALVWKPAH